MVQINPGTGNEREIRLHGQRPAGPEMPKLNFKRLMVEQLSCRWVVFHIFFTCFDGDFLGYGGVLIVIGDLVGVQWWFHGGFTGI